MTSPLTQDSDSDSDPRTVFREAARVSGRMNNAMSHGQITGAQNLLDKAVRALKDEDAQRAARLILRAAQAPYDPWEESSPGVCAASTLVYSAITDQFEAARVGDSTWLDVALAIHPSLDATGQAAVASVVNGFVLQEPFYTLSRAEKRRIQGAFGDAPLEAELGDEPDSTIEQRQAIIMSLVVAVWGLDKAYAGDTVEPPS